MPGSHTGNGHNGDGHNGDGHHDGNGNGSSKNTVAIAGGVGAAGAIAIFSLLILFFLRRQRRKRGEGGAAGAVEKAQGGERKWKKLGSRLRVNVQGLQGPVHTAGPKMTVFKSAGSKLAGIVPERFRRGNGGSNPFGQLRSGSAGSNFVGTRSTATPEANVVNEPQSTIIRSGPLSGWRQMLGERSAEPSPQPYPFLINNPLGRPPVPRNGSAVSLDPFVDPPEPIYLRITNPDPGTPDSNGNTPRPKYLTTGPVAGPGVSPGVSPRPSAAMEPTSYPFPISTPEDPFIDPPANATIKNLDEIPASLVPAALIPRRPIGRTGNNDSNLLQPSQYKPQRAPWSPIPPLPTQTVEDPVPELPRTVPSLPYSVPTNSTFDPTSTIYFVPSSHNSITPIETPLTPDLRSFLSRSASKDTKARSDPFDLDRPEIWASLRSTNARARGSETTDTGRTSKSDGSAILNWEERDRESRITRDRWSRANPGRESPTIGIGY
ncbi:MAG: hypothetical protein M1820_003913 [Bogoriella megaspora]|nr:MAG: hypothetical protein M1820_003913 [Bogoriella megaspora]